MLSAALALLTAQITSVQLGAISVRVDDTTLRFDGEPCGEVARRHTLVTNSGKDDLFIHFSLVYGPSFNGGLYSQGRYTSGESRDAEFVYAPLAPADHRGWVDVLAEYHGDVITAERARIEKLAKKELDEVAEEIRDLLDEADDDAVIFDAMDKKARAENVRAHERIDADLAESARQVMYLRDEYQERRQELLAGNFCTGCGNTRSEILKTGSQFPHPGQSIRAATPAELEALERKYDALIIKEQEKTSRLRREIDSADATMRRNLDAIALKRQKAKERREKDLASLNKEQVDLEARRKALLAEVTVLAGKQSVTRITLLGRCERNP
jgi:hypothetical protein